MSKIKSAVSPTGPQHSALPLVRHGVLRRALPRVSLLLTGILRNEGMNRSLGVFGLRFVRLRSQSGGNAGLGLSCDP